MTLAYSYIRFSRPEQMRGDSLRRQLENARKWAEKRGLVLDDSLRDLGISAFRGKNRIEGALAGFLKLVEDGKVPRGSYLIVESLDRISRESVLDVLPRFLDLIKAGVTVVTLTDGQEYSAERLAKDTSPLFISLVVMTRAHEESKIKSQRLSDAWANKRAVAAQKVVTSRVPAWLEVVVKDGVKVIDEVPDRVRVVKRIFAESISGRGKYSICRDLNSGPRPEPAFQVEEWQPSYIKKLLGNRSVLGEFQAYRRDENGIRVAAGEPIPNYYPVVIDEVTFHRANAARERRTHSGGRHGETKVPLLQGLVRCGACGARMALLNKGERGGRSYTCSDRRRGIHCDNERNWPVATVEDLVVRHLGSNALGDVMEPEPVQEGPSNVDLEVLIEAEEKRAANFLELAGEGFEGARERYRASQAKLTDLKAQLAKVRKTERRQASEPTWDERRERFEAIRARLADVGDQDRDLRSALAQEIRSLLEKVLLGSHSIAYVRRKAIVLGKNPPRVAPITVFNDDPAYVEAIEREEANKEPEASGTPGAVERMLRKYRPGI